jgi:putative transposase
MVSENRSKFTHEGHHTMALDQSALLDLLGQLKLTDVTDRIRTATEVLYQELIDAEAAAFIGAEPFSRPDLHQAAHEERFLQKDPLPKSGRRTACHR